MALTNPNFSAMNGPLAPILTARSLEGDVSKIVFDYGAELIKIASKYPKCAQNFETAISVPECRPQQDFNKANDQCIQKDGTATLDDLKCACNLYDTHVDLDQLDKCSDAVCKDSEEEKEEARRVNREFQKEGKSACLKMMGDIEERVESGGVKVGSKVVLLFAVFAGAVASLTM